jgi:carbamoyl-phosphate synthase large subunit
MKTKVLITGVGGRSVGAGILHSLMRTSGEVRERWTTVASDLDPFSWGLYVADHRALVPAAEDPHYLERILELIEDQQIAAVIPGTEAETCLLAERRDELPVPVIANYAGLMPLMMDKACTEAKLRELKLPYIPSYPWEQRQQALDEFGFPIFVKPTVGTGGSRGVHLITTPAELEALIPTVSPESRTIVQPYLGDGDAEYTVGVLSDQAGRLIDSIVIRRKLMGLSLLDVKTHAGRRAAVSTGVSQGFVVRDPEIQSFCEELAARLGSRGPLNLQLRIHDGRIYVFEIHPRFSGTTPIRASAGFNEPDLLLRDALFGERFGRLPYMADVAAIRAFEHVLVPIDEMLEVG